DRFDNKWIGTNRGLAVFNEKGILGSSTSGLSSKIEMPKGYSLMQNYPNPFNPTTTISYSLPGQSFVKLKVFDILGREVIQLTNEMQTAGVHQAVFNASSLPSGTYFYRLDAGSFTSTKKMIILK
ncbi:MAG: T9SS type A sorting domain-containing protein, partial [Ignavibacteriales bacterium]